MAFLGIAGLMIFFFSIFGISIFITYLLNGFLMKSIAKDYDIKNQWMAWVPVLNKYYYGKVIGILNKSNFFTVVYFSLYILSTIFIFIALLSTKLQFLFTFIGLWLSLGFVILTFIGLRQIITTYLHKNKIIHLLSNLSSKIFLIVKFLTDKLKDKEKEEKGKVDS